VFYLPELLDDLAQAYADTGRFDEALLTIREAVDAGLSGQPDSRCRIAEILMRTGRVDEAEAIWTQVRADAPGDV
jgi:Flp pilus assembly protein TadD